MDRLAGKPARSHSLALGHETLQSNSAGNSVFLSRTKRGRATRFDPRGMELFARVSQPGLARDFGFELSFESDLITLNSPFASRQASRTSAS